eukprot:13396649-Alexandrium_andersonii.AAC.1
MIRQAGMPRGSDVTGLAGLWREGNPAQAQPFAGARRPAGWSAGARDDQVAFGKPRLDSVGHFNLPIVPGLGQ